jgi:hypothetical protein
MSVVVNQFAARDVHDMGASGQQRELARAEQVVRHTWPRIRSWRVGSGWIRPTRSSRMSLGDLTQALASSLKLPAPPITGGLLRTSPLSLASCADPWHSLLRFAPIVGQIDQGGLYERPVASLRVHR